MGKPHLFRMRSPCFGVQWVPSEQHPQGLLLVSGGGGSAKSGVQNQIVRYAHTTQLACWLLWCAMMLTLFACLASAAAARAVQQEGQSRGAHDRCAEHRLRPVHGYGAVQEEG